MIKSLEQIKSEVDVNRFYKPRTISENGWMIIFDGKVAYDFILKLIRNNKLRATDKGLGKVPHYLVRGMDLIRYLETF